MAKIHYHAISIQGRRSQNEDTFIAKEIDGRFLFAVADGLGGHAAGDVASRIATTTLEEKMRTLANTLPAAALLVQAFKAANDAVFRYNQDQRLNAGTTLVAAIMEKGGQTTIANVGDSRAYVLDPEDIWQTRDHSHVQELVNGGAISEAEAFRHPQKNIITRALGLRKEVTVDIYEKNTAGRYLLLCTDGLHSVIRKERIRDVTLNTPPQEATGALTDAALEAEGTDNITVIVVSVPARHLS